MKKVDTITSNEDAVRLAIYNGDLSIPDAAQKLIDMERAQRRTSEVMAEALRESTFKEARAFYALFMLANDRLITHGDPLTKDEIEAIFKRVGIYG